MHVLAQTSNHITRTNEHVRYGDCLSRRQRHNGKKSVFDAAMNSCRDCRVRSSVWCDLIYYNALISQNGSIIMLNQVVRLKFERKRRLNSSCDWLTNHSTANWREIERVLLGTRKRHRDVFTAATDWVQIKQIKNWHFKELHHLALVHCWSDWFCELVVAL